MKTYLNISIPVDGVAIVSCYSLLGSFFSPPLLLPNENVMSCTENLEPCLAKLCIISSTQNTNIISSRLSFETGLSNSEDLWEQIKPQTEIQLSADMCPINNLHNPQIMKDKIVHERSTGEYILSSIRMENKRQYLQLNDDKTSK